MKRLVILLCLLFNACSLYALDTFCGHRLPAELAHSNMLAHDAVEYGTPGSNFGVVRGHQHMPGMQELRNFTYGDNSWQPLVSLKQYSIDRYTVFTVNSCPEILERSFGQSLPETYCLLWLQANQWRFMPILLN